MPVPPLAGEHRWGRCWLLGSHRMNLTIPVPTHCESAAGHTRSFLDWAQAAVPGFFPPTHLEFDDCGNVNLDWVTPNEDIYAFVLPSGAVIFDVTDNGRLHSYRNHNRAHEDFLLAWATLVPGSLNQPLC